jgi:hypothetical protein
MFHPHHSLESAFGKLDSHLVAFSYGLALGKILTHDNLRKREIITVDWCCMSKNNGESVAHILLHCPIARELWDMLLCLLGVTGVIPHSFLAMLESWRGTLGSFRGVWGYSSFIKTGAIPVNPKLLIGSKSSTITQSHNLHTQNHINSPAFSSNPKCSQISSEL